MWLYAHAAIRPDDVDLWDAIPRTIALEAAVPGWRSKMSDDSLHERECWLDEFIECQFLAEHGMLEDWEVEQIRERAEKGHYGDVIKSRIIEGLSVEETWDLARFDFEDDPEQLRAWRPRTR